LKSGARKLCVAGCALLALALLPGCGVRNCLTIDSKGDLSATPPGPCAVLLVTARPTAKAKAVQFMWGSVHTANAESSFAELLAHAAQEDAGIKVLLPFEANQRLQEAKLKPSLQPTADDLRKYVQTLGCTSYLTADVRTWHFGYAYFMSHAEIEYSVACHRGDNGEVIWEATVKRQARGMSDRELARLALSETFQRLKENKSDVPPCPPTEPSG